MFTAKTQAIGAVVEVLGYDLVFDAVGLLLDGVVEDQHAVVAFDGTDGRLHQRPQVAGGVLGPGQESGDLIMAVLVVQQQGQARCDNLRERTDQVIAVQI